MTTVHDGRTFDRLPEHDERSLRCFPAEELLVAAPGPRSYTWACDTWLDQGREGSCVGHGWAHEAAARPKVWPNVTSDLAMRLYVRARQVDNIPDEWGEGTSVLAGAKAAKEAGIITEYRWINPNGPYVVDELATVVSRHGPVVAGTDWRTRMSNPEPDGLVHVEGDVVGGHCYLVRGVSLRRKRFRCRNSWGIGYGARGDFEISFDDMETLVGDGGDLCVPVRT